MPTFRASNGRQQIRSEICVNWMPSIAHAGILPTLASAVCYLIYLNERFRINLGRSQVTVYQGSVQHKADYKWPKEDVQLES